MALSGISENYPHMDILALLRQNLGSSLHLIRVIKLIAFFQSLFTQQKLKDLFEKPEPQFESVAEGGLASDREEVKLRFLHHSVPKEPVS